MADLVRVRINGRDYNVGAAFAKARGLNVLKQPTHNDDGTVRGPSDAPKSSGGGPSPAKEAAKPAETAKEAS